ncbi:hypothetical protein J4429_03425 [Candidatus Pacearchaeota archaeon]|nr:hypothetical protein [Candidatus Pacearchaeota archaeon]
MVKDTKYFVLYLFLFILIVLNLNFVFAADCWSKTSSTCTAANGCKWKNDSWSTTGWCEELNCWSLYTNTECTTTNVPGKNCTWQSGGTNWWCEKLNCWSLSGTSANSCVNNTAGLSCEWNGNCYNSGSSGGTSVNCWNYTSQSSCLNATGCNWGNCNEKGCWSYTTNTTCNAAKDWNGKNCTWSSTNNYCEQNGCWKYYNQTDCTNTAVTKGLNCQWKYSSCQEIDCYTWDGTDAATCVNNSINLSCSWNGNWCNKQDCWNYNTQATCQNQTSCNWKSYTTSGWCNEINCWTWDSWNGGSNSSCINNGTIYGLNCIWNGNPAGNVTNGWCYKNIASTSCANKTTEKDCMDTFYCWWQYTDWNNPLAGGTCNEPGSFGGTTTNTTILNDWNPKCYVFDMNATNCNYTLGCNYTGISCVELSNAYGGNISLNGINCSYINDSQLCNNIPVLSSCCSWQNSSCTANKLSSSCRDQIKQKTEDSCEDAKTSTRCEQIAGDPWYMLCKWNNATTKCEFKASSVFGNLSNSIIMIDNKMNCEAAGGKWILENYCEGNISLPSGRCEYKFDEEDNCDKACFACELKDSNGVSVNATNAETACIGSKSGSCKFEANTNAPNGIGYCSAKSQFKNGIAGDCESNCGDCTYKGNYNNNDTTKRPSYFCTVSKANSVGGGCKWISDNSTLIGGYCINKGEKTCEDACDRCKTQTDCSNIGRTSVANQTGSCKWQGSSSTGSCVNNVAGDVEICWNGVDDTNNGLVDCSDAGCFADSYCGFVEGDCFVHNSSAKCNANNASCEWITDKWGSWCDFKGSQCWKYNSGQSSCETAARIINQSLNITLARISNNNINNSYEFNINTVGTGLVSNSFIVINNTGSFMSSGNYSVDYSTNRIRFLNNSYMVSGQGAGNFTNISYQYYTTNCKWTNGTGSGWCEKNWSVAEVCMGQNRTNCLDLNASGCNWTIDTWCSGSGNGSSWCSSGGGWCDHNDFKPKNCWSYSAIGANSCNAVSGCKWKTDSFSQPHCEVNWSANCWLYSDSSTCNLNSNCIWDTPSQGGGWCMNKADKCWSYSTDSTCNSDARCYWQSYSSGGTSSGNSGMCQSICWNSSSNTQATCSSSMGCSWKQENGWCEESSPCMNSTSSNNQDNCQAIAGCVWKQSGWCDPKFGGFSGGSAASGGGAGGGGMGGGDCFKYDGNQSLCTNKSIINVSCGWTVNPSPSCEINWGNDCWRYTSVANGCNATNNCWFKNDSSGAYCTNIMDQCWQNVSYQIWNNTAWSANCTSNYLCTNNSWGGCEPKCSSLSSSSCTNATYSGKCRYVSGWCNSKGMNDMFEGMESGAPVPLGMDNCPETGIQRSVDLCGFGMKDMGDSYGIGGNVVDFSNASVCNKEKLSSFVMGMAEASGGVGGPSGGFGGGGMTTFGSEKTGAGNDTIIFIVYLDSDGSTTGNCALDSNSSAGGYEFRFKYTSQWNSNTSKAVETFNSDKCDDSSWKAADIKFSTWKKKMCSEIGGPMIAFKKTDLTKYPSLYDSTKDMRIFVATIGNTGNITNPSDSAGPGWTTPGSIDFEIKSAFDYGADSSKFEDILKKGFVQGEDCFNSIDDDNDGNIDCNDWDCQYSSKCSGTGVNAASYSDTSTPLVTGVKIEEYPDSALIMYDTNKPTNGTLELYGYGDTQCLNKTNNIYDIGILSTSVRNYKLWHTALIYETTETMNGYNVSINWPLVAGSTYNYKIKVCDSNNKCAISRCSNFTTPVSSQKCGYCNFVTRIKTPSDWLVAYDVDKNGVYEHIQGQECGPNAGMKTNYTNGRKVNVKLYKSDGSIYIEFLNASLTKTGLNDKVRTISASGSMISNAGTGIVGLTLETRDKIVNNLHPEVCRIKIPVASGTTCNTLYHCDDSGNNCVDRTVAAGGAPIDAVNCVWNVPDCEFSTYKGASASGSTSSSGGGGGGGASGKTNTISESQFNEGYTQSLGSGDKIRFVVSGENHTITLTKISSTSATLFIASKSQSADFSIGDEKSFDVNENGKNDLIVKLNSITNLKASFTIKSIFEKTDSSASVTGEATGSESISSGETNTGIIQESKTNLIWIWVVIAVVIALFIIAIIFYFARKRKKY